MAGVGKLLKQAQKMQRSIESLQLQLEAKEIDITSGGGAVKIKINGAGKFLALTLDPEFLKEDARFVADTLLLAMQDAAKQAKEFNDAEMQKVTECLPDAGDDVRTARCIPAATAMTPAFETLQQQLKQLPGLGFRSSERIALHLLVEKPERLPRWSRPWRRRRSRCAVACGAAIWPRAELCAICADERRDPGARVRGRAGARPRRDRAQRRPPRGSIMCCMANFRPIHGVGPEDLNLDALWRVTARRGAGADPGAFQRRRGRGHLPLPHVPPSGRAGRQGVAHRFWTPERRRSALCGFGHAEKRA